MIFPNVIGKWDAGTHAATPSKTREVA